VGLRLAASEGLEAILADLGHVAEGVRSAPMVLQRAHARGIEMPIVAAVVQVLGGSLPPQSALENLMGREARPESA
jgi:glycerol-3-phosphate dehydrogenase (NAD(P)+)